jgi:hypothetical protein
VNEEDGRFKGRERREQRRRCMKQGKVGKKYFWKISERRTQGEELLVRVDWIQNLCRFRTDLLAALSLIQLL